MQKKRNKKTKASREEEFKLNKANEEDGQPRNG